jgi:hypothetical protein
MVRVPKKRLCHSIANLAEQDVPVGCEVFTAVVMKSINFWTTVR